MFRKWGKSESWDRLNHPIGDPTFPALLQTGRLKAKTNCLSASKRIDKDIK
jgi:hypothetical protein